MTRAWRSIQIRQSAERRLAIGLVFDEQPDTVCCVRLEMTMPHMSGEEAFAAMRRRCPDLKVILMSGYNEQTAISGFVGKGLAGFLQKPFELALLRETVRRVLASE